MVDKINFTQDRIEKLPIPEQGRVDYYDAKITKLTCRVSASGNKSFVVIKKNSAGKAQRVTLGRFPDISVSTVQKLAGEALTDLSRGINPTETKRQEKHQSIALVDLLKKYIDQKDLKPLTASDYQKKLEQGFSDWLTKPVNSITRDMVLMRHKSLAGNKTTRDNKMRVLRLLMRYALALKIITESPTDALKDVGLWSKPTRKDRIIPSDRLKDWYDAVLELPNKKAKVYLLMLLYTGIRANEAINLQWVDVDFKNDTLTIRDTKNRSNFTAYIPKQLKPYIRELQSITGNSLFVFASDSVDGCMDVPRKPIMQVIKQTGVKFSSHDLRRTFATIAEASLLPETLIKRLLNHATDNNVTTGYIRTEANTLKQATNKIADYIQQHTTPESEVITALKTNTG